MEIPKKPLAVSRAKKKLPVELDWGPGIPKDRLRYINAKEEALVKRFRKTKAARDYAGIPAYPDPGDTAAGEKGKTGTTTGKTTGSGSTSGGIGQGGQNKGPGGAGQGPNSSSSTSKTASSTASSGSKTSSSSPSSAPGGSKAPNAAAQAASDKLNGKTSGSTPPKTNAAASVSPSKAPNMAASYASQKLNATSGALKTASQPKSIQGLINSQSASPKAPNAAAAYAAGLQKVANAPRSASGAEGLVQRDWFAGQLGSLFKDPAINKNLPAALREGLWNQRISDATRVAQGLNPVGQFGERTLAPWADAAFRTKQQAAANAKRGTGIKASFHNYGLAADIVTPEMPSPFTKAYKTWENNFYEANKDLAKHIPDNYGIKWGGEFKKVDPAHFQVGSGSRSKAINTYGSNVTSEGIRPDGVVGPTASYGTPTPSMGGSVGLAAAATPKKSALQEALDSWNPPSYSKIPEPDSVGYPGLGNTTVAADPRNNVPKGSYPAAKPESAFAQDPRLSVPQGAYPAAKPPSAFAQDPRLNTPQGSLPAASPTSTLAQDPRLSLPQGAYPARAQTTVAGDPRLSQTPVGAFPAARLSSQVATDPRVSQAPVGAFPAAQKPASVFAEDPRISTTPLGSFPGAPVRASKMQDRLNLETPYGSVSPETLNRMTPEDQQRLNEFAQTPTYTGPSVAQPQSPLPASIPGFSPPGLPGNFRGTAGQAYTYSSPSTFSADNYNPEAAPGDSVPEDDPTYSASPVQGSDNPMQEEVTVEEPAVKQERQKKYASRGATIGSVIAGPLGALIGGTLGWQMGKTTPGQRRSIANSPQALNANAQSINQLAEERGGKNDPNMRVRPEGLKVVLTNPNLVLEKPEAFTDLEQMLAALAAGIDPETGKPIS